VRDCRVGACGGGGRLVNEASSVTYAETPPFSWDRPCHLIEARNPAGQRRKHCSSKRGYDDDNNGMLLMASWSWVFLNLSLAPSLPVQQALRVVAVLETVDGAKWACIECVISSSKT